jgi:hypothetical protein
VLLIAAAGIVVVPTLRPSMVAGTALAPTVPGPPQVGDCLLPPPGPASGTVLPAVGGSTSQAGVAGTSPRLIAPRVVKGVVVDQYGPCDGTRLGEVTVVKDPAGALDASSADSVSGPCAMAADSYSGLPAPGAPPQNVDTPTVVAFEPSLYLPVAVLLPDDRQRAAGQRWEACTVSSPDPSGYVGSLQGVFDGAPGGHTLPTVFATCRRSATDQTTVGCDDPHQVEVLGYRLVPLGPQAQRAALRGCLEFAGRMLDRSDPTSGGSLQVVSLFDESSNEAMCQIESTGSRYLIGSIIGLGDRPLPWAS